MNIDGDIRPNCNLMEKVSYADENSPELFIIFGRVEDISDLQKALN